MKPKPAKVKTETFTVRFDGDKTPLTVTGDKINDLINKEKRRYIVYDSDGQPVFTKGFKG